MIKNKIRNFAVSINFPDSHSYEPHILAVFLIYHSYLHNPIMKKSLILAAILISAATMKAQTDVQALYHFTNGEKHLTSTVEMFKTDNHGSNYFFVDFDYGVKDVKGATSAYWEISRGIKFWKAPFEIHVEYDGGLGQYVSTPTNGAYTINDAWLFGGQYTWNTADFSKIFTLQAMYKTIRDKNKASFQITGVWTLNFFKKKFTASGFLDFWKEDNTFADGSTRDYTMVSQPQFWYNLDEHLSLGSEIDLSYGFASHKNFYVNPTIAAKWTF